MRLFLRKSCNPIVNFDHNLSLDKKSLELSYNHHAPVWGEGGEADGHRFWSDLNRFIFCLRVSTAEHLWKHIVPRSGPAKCRAWSWAWSKMPKTDGFHEYRFCKNHHTTKAFKITQQAKNWIMKQLVCCQSIRVVIQLARVKQWIKNQCIDS